MLRVPAKEDRPFTAALPCVSPWQTVAGYKAVTVEAEDAGLYHFRLQPMSDGRVPVARDTSMQKYYDGMASHPLLQPLMRAATSDLNWTLSEAAKKRSRRDPGGAVLWS